MEELRELLNQILNERLQQMILSNARDSSKGAKWKIRPVKIKGELYFQKTAYIGTQVFHENLSEGQVKEVLLQALSEQFKQAQIQCADREVTVLVSKKGKCTIKTKKLHGTSEQQGERDLSHNRTKQYILKEGEPVDFLVSLGVQSADGHIASFYYDKFRQINRYLEFIEDICDRLPGDRTIRIIDFGCGKSYLTFAMYYYLKILRGKKIRVTGLDLKESVMLHCNELAKKLHYDDLNFEIGDIKDYQGENRVDMVVSLHACDKATDYAIEKAVRWGASVILAVPCCQHELNRQIKCKELQSVLKYGLLKERMAALLTDGIRAQVLESCGYDTQILEFIDMEHTPKNIMIRAVKTERMKSPASIAQLDELMEFLHVKPTVASLLSDRWENQL